MFIHLWFFFFPLKKPPSPDYIFSPWVCQVKVLQQSHMCRAGWCGPGLKHSELPLSLRFTTRTTSLYFLWNLPDFIPLCWAVLRRYTHTHAHTPLRVAALSMLGKNFCQDQELQSLCPHPLRHSIQPSPLRISHFLGLHWRGRTNLTPYWIWFFFLL